MKRIHPVPPTQLVLTWSFVLAFLVFRHLMHEAHEFAHMIAGRLSTGEWGTRDFNNVQPFSTNVAPALTAEIITALAGPLVNYLGCLIGGIVIHKSKEIRTVAMGLVLIFACLPFARIFTAIMGGGDEYGIMRLFISNAVVARTVTIATVTALFAWPLYKAYRSLPIKNRLRNYFAFLFAPMLIEGALVLGLLNRVLKSGVLAQGSYFGAPLFVLVVLGFCVLFLLFMGPRLTTVLTVQPEIPFTSTNDSIDAPSKINFTSRKVVG
jgi:hypothetical protein